MASKMTPLSAGLERRTFLQGAAALTAAAGISGFPAILKGQEATIKIGMPTILSGRVAILGQTSRDGALWEFEKFNAEGGLNGRKLELIARDSKGKPDEAARVTRDLVNNEGCQIIFDAEASSGAFAVHEVARDLGFLCIHTNSETSSLTADPKQFIPTTFRSARQGIHDAVGGGAYAARVAKEKGLKRWMSCSPDYAYGRDSTATFMEYAKHFYNEIELVDQAWPKLFQPDYTEVVTKILSSSPQAMYSALWGGDLVAFTEQATLYGLFQQVETFATNLGDYPILTAVKQLPEGVHCGNRYNKHVPPTDENAAWHDAYVKRFNGRPTNWSWENGAAALFLIAAMREVGDVDAKKLAEAMEDMTIDVPFGVDGKMTMRGSDHTVINYAVGYGLSVPQEPYITNFQSADWDTILDIEKQWKKEQGYI